MRVEVVGAPDPARLVLLLVALLLVAPWTVAQGGPWALAALLAVALAAVLWDLRLVRRGRPLVEAVGPGGLARPLKVTPGFLELGYRRRGRYSDSLLNFREVGPPAVVDRLEWRHAWGYGAAFGPDWAYAVLPAFRVESRCCRGYIALLDPGRASWSWRADLAASGDRGDWAQASLEVRDGVARALVNLWPAAARAARLELAAETPMGRAVVRLAETARGAARAERDLRGSEAVLLVVVGPPDDELPSILSSLAGGASSGVLGLGPPLEYRARLVIDIPHGRDVVAETPLVPAGQGDAVR